MINKLFYLSFFILLLVFSRLIPHPPNFTPILASSIIAPFMLNNRFYGMFIPVLAMLISDIIIGLHVYQFVIYLTIASISLVSPTNKNFKGFLFIAISGSLWFFITTNFAVWLSSELYSKDIEGLILCYTLAIPFFSNTIISTCLFTLLLAFFSKPLELINEKTSSIIMHIINKSNRST